MAEYECECGEKHTYPDEQTEKRVEALINQLGNNVELVIERRRFIVPRRYIAFHGKDDKKILERGFNEIK